MNRQELYAKIKELNLQKLIKEECGDNFTRVKTEVLNKIIAKFTTKKLSTKNAKNVNCNCNKDRCTKLIEVLKKKHILLDSEITYINS